MATLGIATALIALVQTWPPSSEQPVLGRGLLTITRQDRTERTLEVEMALSPREQQTGLMFRTKIPISTGMLFLWEHPQRSAMWMKHCPVPEDMIFIGTSNRVVQIASNTIPFSETVVRGQFPDKAVLEVHGGEAAALGLAVGDRVRWETGVADKSPDTASTAFHYGGG